MIVLCSSLITNSKLDIMNKTINLIASLGLGVVLLSCGGENQTQEKEVATSSSAQSFSGERWSKEKAQAWYADQD